jgi:sulfur relay (sulfurtransferase) complex TusBCD TusD component (DsrE family)
MARALCVLVNHPPYGSLEPAESLRHARGALAKGWRVVLACLGDGVSTLLPDQAPAAGEWVSLSEAVAQFLEEGQGQAEVLAEASALDARGLALADLVPGVRSASLGEIAQVMARCDRTLTF